MRKTTVCTAATLQRELMKARGVQLDTSTIRKVLGKRGYRWLPKAQKPAVDHGLQKRVKFAKASLRMSKAELQATFAFYMDGVVLSRPPTNPSERTNLCKQGITHMHRKKSERAQPDLAGDDLYSGQIPAARCVPIWGGIGHGGCAVVAFHRRRNITGGEWLKAVKGGKLKKAIASVRPARRHGPWKVVCDGERFLWSKSSRKACADCNVTLWQLPPKSPDMNPVERFWGWLRKQLLLKDLADLQARRPVLSPTAYKARVRGIMRTKMASTRAAKFVGDFRRVCKAVVNKKGARVK